jgi:hypothetical protein
MTPRRISALLQIKHRRVLAEQAELMHVIRTAMHAEDVPFRRTVKKLHDEGQ